MDGKVIAVWFSCGAASAVAAKKTIEMYGKHNTIRVLNNPIAEEHSDNWRFLKDVQKWLGIEIEIVTNPAYPTQSCKDVWDDRQFMSSPYGAPCTQLLKQDARRRWEMQNHHDYKVLGFTSDEPKRYNDFARKHPNTLPILINAGITKKDCFQIIQQAGLELPEIYKLGYPNANCIGCVKASSATYWNHVRGVHPEVFNDRAEQSREFGAKLVRCHPKYLPFCSKHNGEWYDDRTGQCLHKTDEKTGKRKLESPRIFLDELPPNAKGRPMKNLDFECGVFCK